MIARSTPWSSNNLSSNPRRVINRGDCWHTRTVGGEILTSNGIATLKWGDICININQSLPVTYAKVMWIGLWSNAIPGELTAVLETFLLQNASPNPCQAMDMGHASSLAKVRFNIPYQQQKVVPTNVNGGDAIVSCITNGTKIYFRVKLKYQL